MFYNQYLTFLLIFKFSIFVSKRNYFRFPENLESQLTFLQLQEVSAARQTTCPELATGKLHLMPNFRETANFLEVLLPVELLRPLLGNI